MNSNAGGRRPRAQQHPARNNYPVHSNAPSRADNAANSGPSRGSDSGGHGYYDVCLTSFVCHVCPDFHKGGAFKYDTFMKHVLSPPHQIKSKARWGVAIEQDLKIPNDEERYVVLCRPRTINIWDLAAWASEFGVVTDIWDFTYRFNSYVVTLMGFASRNYDNAVVKAKSFEQQTAFDGIPVRVFNRRDHVALNKNWPTLRSKTIKELETRKVAVGGTVPPKRGDEKQGSVVVQPLKASGSDLANVPEQESHKWKKGGVGKENWAQLSKENWREDGKGVSKGCRWKRQSRCFVYKTKKDDEFPVTETVAEEVIISDETVVPAPALVDPNEKVIFKEEQSFLVEEIAQIEIIGENANVPTSIKQDEPVVPKDDDEFPAKETVKEEVVNVGTENPAPALVVEEEVISKQENSRPVDEAEIIHQEPVVPESVEQDEQVVPKEDDEFPAAETAAGEIIHNTETEDPAPALVVEEEVISKQENSLPVDEVEIIHQEPVDPESVEQEEQVVPKEDDEFPAAETAAGELIHNNTETEDPAPALVVEEVISKQENSLPVDEAEIIHAEPVVPESGEQDEQVVSKEDDECLAAETAAGELIRNNNETEDPAPALVVVEEVISEEENSLPVDEAEIIHAEPVVPESVEQVPVDEAEIIHEEPVVPESVEQDEQVVPKEDDECPAAETAAGELIHNNTETEDPAPELVDQNEELGSKEETSFPGEEIVQAEVINNDDSLAYSSFNLDVDDVDSSNGSFLVTHHSAVGGGDAESDVILRANDDSKELETELQNEDAESDYTKFNLYWYNFGK